MIVESAFTVVPKKMVGDRAVMLSQMENLWILITETSKKEKCVTMASVLSLKSNPPRNERVFSCPVEAVEKQP